MSGFHEVRFPDEISYGSSGGPGFSTSIIETDSGKEQRVARRSTARHQYDISLGTKDLAHFTEVKAFFMARSGAANGFRYKDWGDYHSNPDGGDYHTEPGEADQDTVPPVGDGERTSFQLAKTYVSGPSSHVRLIHKPVEGTIRVWVNGVEQMSGWSVDLTSGEVIFDDPVPLDHPVQWSGEFDVPVRASQEVDRLLSMTVEDYGRGSIPSINLVEILQPGPSASGSFFYGGSRERVFSSNIVISMGLARFWNLSASTTGLSAILPSAVGHPPGGPIFYIANSGANSFTVKDAGDNTLATLAAGEATTILLTVDGAGDPVWCAIA